MQTAWASSASIQPPNMAGMNVPKTAITITVHHRSSTPHVWLLENEELPCCYTKSTNSVFLLLMANMDKTAVLKQVSVWMCLPASHIDTFTRPPLSERERVRVAYKLGLLWKHYPWHTWTDYVKRRTKTRTGMRRTRWGRRIRKRGRWWADIICDARVWNEIGWLHPRCTAARCESQNVKVPPPLGPPLLWHWRYNCSKFVSWAFGFCMRTSTQSVSWCHLCD